MAISNLTITKFSAGRIEGTLDTDAPHTVTVTLTKNTGGLTGTPSVGPFDVDASMGPAGNGVGIPFVITALAGAHTDYAGLAPGNDYKVTESVGSSFVQNLEVKDLKGPNSSQAVVHVLEGGQPGSLDPNSRMDAGEYFRAELDYIKEISGVGAGTNEIFAEHHMGAFAVSSGAGGLQGANNKSIKAVFEEVEAKLSNLATATSSGLSWKDDEANLSTLVETAVADGWVQGDCAWVSGPGLGDRNRYVLINANTGGFNPATRSPDADRATDLGFDSAAQGTWTGSSLNGKSFVIFSDAKEMLDLIDLHAQSQWDIIDGTSTVGSEASAFSLNETTSGGLPANWRQQSSGATRTAKNVFQLLINEDVDLDADIIANDGEITALQTEMGNLRSVVGGSISSSSTAYAHTVFSGGAGSPLYDAAVASGGGGSNLLDIRSALEALEAEIEGQKSLSFAVDASYSSASGDVLSHADVVAADAGSSFMQVWINGVMVASKTPGNTLANGAFGETALALGDSVVVLKSKK